MTITNLSNTIITADVNAHSLLWYLPTKDHRGKLMKDILLNSNHITLNINIPTYLPPNQTQQPTLPDITTTSADLHAGRPSTFSHPIPYLYLSPSIYITRPTCFHFTKTITNCKKADWTSFKQHVENLICYRPHSTNVHFAC